jgi:hypothetical protein
MSLERSQYQKGLKIGTQASCSNKSNRDQLFEKPPGVSQQQSPQHSQLQ